MPKVTVNQATCAGSGFCQGIAPEYFEVGSEMVAKVLREEVADDDRDAVEEAVYTCPAQAIEVRS